VALLVRQYGRACRAPNRSPKRRPRREPYGKSTDADGIAQGAFVYAELASERRQRQQLRITNVLLDRRSGADVDVQR
jgi:hypothetical protein